MFTIKYKNWFIHGYCDKKECRIQSPGGQIIKPVKSLLSAKRAITKLIGI